MPLPANSVHGILLASVLSSMDAHETVAAIRKSFFWLAPGGKILLVTPSIHTPSLSLIKRELIFAVGESQKARRKAKLENRNLTDGEAFPLDFNKWLAHRGHLHALGLTDEALKEIGFEINTARYFSARTPFRWQDDGA